MKLLTVNFLTCAVKSCKASLSTTTTTTTTITSDPSQSTNPSDPSPSSPSSSSPFPLHFRDALLERTEIPYNPRFIQNILPRVSWEALTVTATELGLRDLLPSPTNPVDDPSFVGLEGREAEGDGGGGAGEVSIETAAMDIEGEERGGEAEGEAQSRPPPQTMTPQEKDKILRQLHTLLLETAVTEGKLVCGRCEFEYPIKEGVGNFLLPSHLGE